MVEGFFAIEHNRTEALLQEIDLAREEYRQVRHVRGLPLYDGRVRAANERIRQARALRFDLVRTA
jgi:hypothetical protein